LLEPVARRLALKTLALGAFAASISGFVSAARATSDGAARALARLTGGVEPRPGRIALDLPELAGDGAAVPLTLSVDSPMTDADHVRAIHVVSEANPSPEVVSFRLTPLVGKAEIATRVRLAESQSLLAAAEMSDGRVYAARRRVVVTTSGCGVTADEASQTPQPSAKVKVTRRGQLFEVRTLIEHPMETGFRKNKQGDSVPRHIVRSLECTLDGRPVLAATLHTGVAANPFFAFPVRADRGGTFRFTWTDDRGATVVETRPAPWS
jgi:sulfur-oxidizing protein SoxY